MVLLQICEFAACFAEMMTGIYLCKTILSEKENQWKQNICGAFLVSLMIWILNQREIFSYGITVAALMGITISIYAIYKVSKIDVIIIAAFYYILVYIVDFSTLSVAGLVLKEDQMAQIIAGSFSYLRVYIMAISKTILIFIAFVLTKKVSTDISLPIRKMWSGIGVSVCVLLYLIERTFAGVNTEVTAAWFLLLAFLILAVYSTAQYFKYLNDKRMWQMNLEQNRLQIETYNKLIQVYQENYRFYHDLKNQFLILDNYIRRKEFDKAEEYMRELKIPGYDDLYKKRTGIHALDILLNYKIREAEAQGIPVRTDIELVNVRLTEQELTALIGNALDNAIEACKKMKSKDKWIDISIHKKHDMTFIKIRNSYEEQPMEKSGHFISTKENPQLHGQGIKGMKMIVDKYDGVMKVTYSKEEFAVSISFFH